MKTKLKKSVFALILIIIFLIPLVSVAITNVKNPNSQTSLTSEDQLEALKTSDDTSAPVITNIQLSDEILEFRDTQTITCNITDESKITFVYLTIWFGSNQENWRMTNIIGDKYQLEWSSIDAELGTYNIDIRAQDEWGNAETVENVATFTIVTKPMVYVDSLSYKHAQIIGDVDYLKPYDAEELIIEGNQLYDNGNDALYCAPDKPWYTTTLYGANNPSTPLVYSPGWSASSGDSKFFSVGCAGWVGYTLFAEYRPRFYVRNAACPDEKPTDIEITLNTILTYRANPSISIYIYNYNTSHWVLLSSSGLNAIVSGQWSTSYHFNKDHLLPRDSDLSHFVSDDGFVDLRLEAASACWATIYTYTIIPFPPFVIPVFAPYAAITLTSDICNVKATYCPASTVSFNFEDEEGTNLLNGEDDYYLYFKGKTINGHAQLNVNGEKEFDISTRGTMKDEPRPVELYNVSDISITGEFDEVNISYLYLKKMRDPPIHSIEVATLEDNNKIKGPMSGYYPGTYGFENDEIGTCPEDWLNTTSKSTVIASLDGHEKVLSVGETDVVSNCHTEFPDKSSGIIEFWIQAEANSQTSFYFDEDLLIGGTLTLVDGNGNWEFFGESTPAKANAWYHLKLKFNKVADFIKVYVDSVLIQTYTYGALGNINQLSFTSNGAHFDAIDFSWSDGYIEGRNINEGFLLDFDSYYEPEWIAYKLTDFENLEEFDSLPFTSVHGDTVIPMPKNGPCELQAYGEDSEGNHLISNTIQFSVDYNRDFHIIWPKQKTYKNLAFYKFYLLFETIDDIISTQVSIDGQTPVEISEFQPIDPGLVIVQLPIPAEGEHQIQLFARNSQGDLYQTEIKEFNFDMEINLEGIQDGDSLKGGDDLNLKLNPPVELSELGYILDGEPNPIEGDSFINLDLSINISEIGTHTIQAYGSDLYGNEYISESRSFITTPFNIISPEEVVSLTEEGEDIDLIFNAYTFLENIKYSIDGQDFIAGEYSEKQISILCKEYSTSIGTLDRGYHTLQLKGTGKITGITYYSQLKTFEVMIHDISLICVHGFSGGASAFDFIKDNTDFTNYYGVENIWAVNYVWEPRDPEFANMWILGGYGVNLFESISIIARGLRNYIINRHEAGDLKDNIDLFAHSMGGLVVRCMIKAWYPDLQARGITIRHVATAGTPNHGTWSANMGYFLSWNLQILNMKFILDMCDYLGVPFSCMYEMGTLSGLLLYLNTGDETPYDISYYTYAGNTTTDVFYNWALGFATINLFFFITLPLCAVIKNAIGIYYDDVVTTGSVPLIGAVANREYKDICHGGIYTNPIVLRDIISDFKT